MPKRTDLKSILIIGAGPIVIGQACEFDYSGAQACKALREEGYRVILVNSNPATIMTDPETADAIYIEPVQWRTVARIIEKERPDAVLPTMGGQTALNCALDLVREGVLERFGCELIGASREAIDMAEDRELFREAMKDIGLETARAHVVHSMEEALATQAEIGYPTVIRPSFTLGGTSEVFFQPSMSKSAARCSNTAARGPACSMARGLSAGSPGSSTQAWAPSWPLWARCVTAMRVPRMSSAWNWSITPA